MWISTPHMLRQKCIERRIAKTKSKSSEYLRVLRAQWKSFKFTFKVAWTMASQDAQLVVAQVDDSQSFASSSWVREVWFELMEENLQVAQNPG